MGQGIFRFKVGQFDCRVISDGDDFNRNTLLVSTGRHQVLVETGNGDSIAIAGLLVDRLRETGVPPDEVDIVIHSHADWDHIGGAADNSGKAIFPNARYVMLREEWAFWSSAPERLRPSPDYTEDFRRLGREIPRKRLAQLSEKWELVDSGAEPAPGIRIIAAPGHTPGYALVSVMSDGEQLLYIGDLLYQPQNIENPDWYSVYDYDPEQVVITRRRVLEQVAREQTLLLAYHVAFPGLGRVRQHGTGWQWSSLE